MPHHLLPEQRRRQIMATLAQDGSVTVVELARALDVTETTVRRDINHLAAQGSLQRVHGGAVAAATGSDDRDRSRNPPTVGMVVPTDEFHWGAITSSVRAAARSSGVGLRVHRDDEVDSDLLAELARHDAPDGWLLGPPLDPERRESFDAWLDLTTTPTVLVEREPTPGVGHGVQSVCSDHRANAATVVRHLARLGHRRIALMVPTGGARADEYVDGWDHAITWFGLDEIPVMPSIDIIDPARSELAQQVIAALRRDQPTAIMVLGDPHAMVLVQICQEVGIRVPEDLSVVALGDYMATWAALTAFRPPYEALGATALRLLLHRIRGGSVAVGQHVRLEGRLIVRETVAPPGGHPSDRPMG